MKKQAFLFVETQFDNLGDALINRELIKLVSHHAQTTVGISRVPKKFLEKLDIAKLSGICWEENSGRSRFLLNVLWRRVRGARCYVFLSPGGWIGELDGNLNLRSWGHAAIYFLLSQCGVQIYQIGVSYESLGPKLLRLLRARSHCLTRHLVRDSRSFELLKDLNIRVDGVCPDLAFNVFSELCASERGNGVTLSFRADQYPGQLDDIKMLVELVLKLCDPERPIYLVYQVEKDRAPMLALGRWINGSFGLRASVDQGDRDIAFTQSLYRRSTAIVSNRLHSLLLAGSVGNAMIAAPVGGQNAKIASLFSDIGLGGQVFGTASNLDETGVARLERAMNNWERCGTSAQMDLRETVATLFSGDARFKLSLCPLAKS